MIWFTADTHLGHEKIISHCNRPYSSIEEHDDALISNINQRVERNDTLYHLGDFAFKQHKIERIRQYTGRIKCRNVILIAGNHDLYRPLTGLPHESLATAFFEVHPYLVIRPVVKGIRHKIILFHYPMVSWRAMKYGSWHLHGHSHGECAGSGFRLDVGVDTNMLAPICLGEVMDHMISVGWNPDLTTKRSRTTTDA